MLKVLPLDIAEKMALDNKISGDEAFLLFQSYGFPIEMTCEIAIEKGLEVINR